LGFIGWLGILFEEIKRYEYASRDDDESCDDSASYHSGDISSVMLENNDV
jgi:hypothetical protein